MIGQRLAWCASLAAMLTLAACPAARGEPSAARVEQLALVIQRGLADGVIVGAQSAVGSREGPVQLAEQGLIAPDSRDEVDEETLFCIGSCSKPFASACLLSLDDAGTIDLDTPIDQWLPAFGGLKLPGGGPAERAPTLRELLSHRGGIYSQKRGPMTPEQTRAIRDFRLTLEESVEIISHQPLLANPGETFAYSGAGYCVLGRAVEAATDQSFEEIFQERIAGPLNLTRTTYFPSPEETNISTGGSRQQGRIVTHPRTPFLLGEDLRFPLIGGSLHSTAAETARFVRMILDRGKWDTHTVLSKESWKDLTRPHYEDQTYGLGWTLSHVNGEISSMQHGGALYSHRSLVYVDVTHGTFGVVHWTVAEEGAPLEKPFRQQLLQAVKQVTAG